ncbi:hypothetical protein MJ904_23265 [Massilia sp. MB5]|uniref:hypothetical protein n=1 Tax=Massilia sp. MB5 TaxID=2919578 RepID=UPI001F111ED6|nr:hypothetical protein [Massilia sp. MB5]UMR29916.1 hypothetical protein MJ904_23265 [Massilia sp. MB5]
MEKLSLFDRLKSFSASVRASMELEPGEFGLRAVPKGGWEARQQAYCVERQIHELHFNHAKGYQSTGSYAFLAGLAGLQGLKVLDPLLEDLDFLAAQPRCARSTSPSRASYGAASICSACPGWNGSPCCRALAAWTACLAVPACAGWRWRIFPARWRAPCLLPWRGWNNCP